MDACARCGATLSPDLAWCSQCYAPVRGAGPAGATTPAAGPAPEEARPLWVRTQMRPTEPKVVPVYSRFRAGPTSLGAFGRILLTALVIAGAIVGYPMARGGMLVAIGMDIPGPPFMIAYGFLAGAAVIYLLARIWKRARVA